MVKPFRVPLAGPYNSRVSAVNASDSSSGYVGVGIVGLMVVGKTTQATDKDGRYINCFAQTVTDPVTGDKRVYTVKRPGFGTFNTPASGQKGYAVMVWTGAGDGTSVISAFGAANSAIYNGEVSLGSITGTCNSLTETEVSGVPTIIATSNDSTAWYYDGNVGTMTQISDADYPGNDGYTVVGQPVHIDGYMLVMTSDAKLWASDLNSVTSWTATSFDTASAYPDKGVGLVRSGQYVLAFGAESLQFYYNAGQTPFPLACAKNKTVKIGAISADAISRIGDTIFWCGTTPEGGISIFQYSGEAVSRLSTPEIEAVLILAGATNISLSTSRFYGRSFVLVRAGPTTLAYCMEERMWHEWNSTTPLWYKCAAVMLGATLVNYAVSNVSTSGKVYLMNPASLVFTDDGNAYTARVQLPSMDLGTSRRKFWKSVELIADTEASTSDITLSYSDDDYQTYTTWGDLDLSDSRVRAQRLGSSRKRGWVWTHSAATPMRLEAMEGMVEIGTA